MKRLICGMVILTGLSLANDTNSVIQSYYGEIQQEQQQEDIYNKALNYQAGKKVIGNPTHAKPQSFQFFSVDIYLRTIQKVRDIYKPVPKFASELKVKPIPQRAVQTQSELAKEMAMMEQNRKVVKEKRVIGYCQFDRDIKVYGNQKMFVNIPCWFEGMDGVSTLYGELIPDLKNYSLVLKPIEIFGSDGKIYRVVAGYALSGDRSSPNIATEVNLRRIEKILARSGQAVGQDMRELSKEYAKNEQTEVNVDGDVVVKKSEINLNILGKSALVDAIASAVEGISDMINKETQNIPITFTIRKGAMVFVNAIIKPEELQAKPTPIVIKTEQTKPKKTKPVITSY